MLRFLPLPRIARLRQGRRNLLHRASRCTRSRIRTVGFAMTRRGCRATTTTNSSFSTTSTPLLLDFPLLDHREEEEEEESHAGAARKRSRDHGDHRYRLEAVHPDRLTVSFRALDDHHYCNPPSSSQSQSQPHSTAHTVSSSTFHAPWLWSNDPGQVHRASGQRLRSPWTFYQCGARIAAAEIVRVAVAVADEEEDGGMMAVGVVAVRTTTMTTRWGRLHQYHHRHHRAAPCTPWEVPTRSKWQTMMLVGAVWWAMIPNHHNNKRSLLYVTWKTTAANHPHDGGSSSSSSSKAQSPPPEQEQQVVTTTTTTSVYDLDWLARCRYDATALDERQTAVEVRKEQSLHRGYALQTMNYHCLLLGASSLDNNSGSSNNSCGNNNNKNFDDARFDLLHAVMEEGAALVQQAPPVLSRGNHNDDDDDDNATVGAVGRLLTSGGRLSHGSLYGDIFHVQTVNDAAHNIAYTGRALAPHQDLAYYESPPGLQLLHCVQNSVATGGESVLVDGLAAAHEFRRLAPDLFDVLVRCDATFVKQRQGGDMVYRRPHINVSSSTGSVVSVHWSPPFEGPLSIAADQVEDYYVAYSAFQRMLDNSLPRVMGRSESPTAAAASSTGNRLLPMLPLSLEQDLCDYAHTYTWEYRLEPGEILIFNNLRMLHGRRGFTTTVNKNGESQQLQRHLIGCYTNIDDTLNEYRLLRRQRYPHLKELPYIRNAGNGSSSST